MPLFVRYTYTSYCTHYTHYNVGIHHDECLQNLQRGKIYLSGLE